MAFETSSSTIRSKYEVFLSFRGKDTRNNFTDHLYAALKWTGIQTFRDNDEIDRGENIDKEIEIAIQQSQISVIVFSKEYASSKWCLDELVMIMQRTETSRHVAIPVFYDVDPSDVSEQTGSFGEAFASHENCFNKEEVDRWRDALSKVSNLGGMVLGDRPEAQFIQEIVKSVESKLNRTPLFISPHLVGIEARIGPINMWLKDESRDVGIGIIYGIGGIGKTTMANIVYNQNFHMFEASCFLANVRETTNQPNGSLLLQKQLLKRIAKTKEEINSVPEGLMKIKRAIYDKRILIVLDDVDSVDQFNAIVGMEDWLCHGSKIIITTRNELMLQTKVACKKFEVDALEEEESLKLFSMHAFRQAYSVEEYEELSVIAVSHCCGLPLALEVLGSALSGRDRGYWVKALKRPEEFGDEGKVQRVLRISYDSLRNNRDKNLFLDISCFFINKDKIYVDKMVEACGDSYNNFGIENLVNKCLIKIENNLLTMHQLLRDMGRKIVHEESEDPEKRSRIWCHKDAFNILTQKKIGTETVKSLMFDKKQAQTNLGNMDLIRIDAFRKMSNLKLLHLDGVSVNWRCEEFPKGLVWLSWHHFPLNCFPHNFPMDDLIILDMEYGNMKRVWKGTPVLTELRVLNLSHCHGLMGSPNFSGLSNLEMLIFEGCVNLVEVHESIGVLERLVLLNLKDCVNLGQLPEKLSMLKSLETLLLSGCSKLKIPTEIFAKLESLEFLYMDGVVVNQSQSATKIWPLMSFHWLSRRKCPSSTTFSLAFLPRSLMGLSLQGCNLLDENLPRDFSCLPLLKWLDLSRNPIQFLPESIGNLTKLKCLRLSECERLQSLPELPRSLIEISVKNHDMAAQCVMNDSFESRELELITDDDMNMIREVGLFNLESKEGIEVEMFDVIREKTRGRAPLQILREYGRPGKCDTFSIFLPGSDIPHWFSHQTEGFKLSFVAFVPPGYRMCGFNLCVVYESKASIVLDYKALKCRGLVKDTWQPLRTSWMRERQSWTKKYGISGWINGPTIVGITESHQDMLWLSHWRFAAENEDLGELYPGHIVPLAMYMESGDRMEVTVERVFNSKNYVKKCGINLVYRSQNEESSPNYHHEGSLGMSSSQSSTMMSRINGKRRRLA